MKLNEDKIKSKVEELNGEFPNLTWGEEDLWERVSSQLDSKERQSPGNKWYAIAAALILLISASIYILIGTLNQESVTYAVAVETIVSEEEYIDNDLDVLTLSFIRESCLKDLQVCNTEEFKELKIQLDETSFEIDNLNEMIAKYGDTPDLVKSKIKIENFRSEIMRQLVQIITS